MSIELRVPEMGESITEVFIGAWLKAEGEAVERDAPVVEIESDKATVELPAPVSGTLSKVLKKPGERAGIGEVIGYMEEGVLSPEAKSKKKGKDNGGGSGASPASSKSQPPQTVSRAPAPVAAAKAAPAPPSAVPVSQPRVVESGPRIMPAAQRELADHNLSPEDVHGTGPGGRVLKEDVLSHVEALKRKESAAPAPPAPTAPSPAGDATERRDEAVPMTPMRRRIAERLVQAQHTAALLTTFNEVDMSAVIALREEYKSVFQERYGVKLGFMSFFVKAAVDALKTFPQINAEIQGDNIVYHNYYDIGISVGGGKGLVVPILRNVEKMGYADIEQAIGDFAKRARENKLAIQELQGGTFTISNGGVYGSMLSTPIVNPPQSAILGMHAIQDRPMAVGGQVVIRPIMYVALTYDHRIVDGREAVSFLKRIKECIEAPSRILLEI